VDERANGPYSTYPFSLTLTPIHSHTLKHHTSVHGTQALEAIFLASLLSCVE